MSVSFLFDGNFIKFKEFSNEFFDKNAELKHAEMEMEMLMLSGYIYNFVGDLNMSRHFYTKGLEQSNLLSKEFYKAVCLSNIGIIDAEKESDELFDQLDIDIIQEEDENLMENENSNMMQDEDGNIVDEDGNIIEYNQNDNDMYNYNDNNNNNFNMGNVYEEENEDGDV